MGGGSKYGPGLTMNAATRLLKYMRAIPFEYTWGGGGNEKKVIGGGGLKLWAFHPPMYFLME